MSKAQKVKPHVVVELYPVQEQTFNDNPEIDYWHAEVTHKGLLFNELKVIQTTKKGVDIYNNGQTDPMGWTEYGDNETVVKAKMREYLKECGFSKKQTEFKKI